MTQSHEEREAAIAAVARDMSDRDAAEKSYAGGCMEAPIDVSRSHWKLNGHKYIATIRDLADAGHIVGVDRLYADYPAGQVRIDPTETIIAIRCRGGQSDYTWEAVARGGETSVYRDGDVRGWDILHTPKGNK